MEWEKWTKLIFCAEREGRRPDDAFMLRFLYKLAEGVGVVITTVKRLKGDLRGPIGELQHYN